MDRKEFLATTFSAGLGLALVPSLLSCVTPMKRSMFDPLTLRAGDLRKIRGNVSRYTNKGGTVGVFEAKDGFLIIDSQFADSIQPVLDGISSKGKPVLYLCNTHHHGDHTSGNIAFKDQNTKVVAHQRVPELQRMAAEKSKKLAEQRYATVLFEKEYRIDLGNEKVTGYHFGNGHTFGDVMYHFENDNVVHMGDLMFNNMIPVYRTADGSDSRSWIKVLEKAQAKFDDDTVFIFGHADKPELTTGNRANLKEMAGFLEASNDFMLKAISEGKSTEQLVKENAFIPGFENRNTPERFAGFLDELRKTLLG
ncbi:MBL fold metallo-hydrolase [Chryseobacterium sp.]|uniref:MBL fold metallo-hydrolase n=1 Tax=Chryseobacterium sp. TaxID=1871047 RepID=UPI0011C9701A|nr:MBL fold metallo-hydrolase [Chryseobacterium sp.]TXF77197.1 MBL fold metallo-hydrolase [Chryseobacterium sp.]